MFPESLALLGSRGARMLAPLNGGKGGAGAEHMHAQFGSPRQFTDFYQRSFR